MREPEKYSSFRNKLGERKAAHRLRRLVPADGRENRTRIGIGGEEFLNFCSNDYLGLATNPEVIRRSVDFSEKYGAGTSASRLISGSLEIHHRLEEKIAALFDREAAMLFGSGFQANVTILPALAGRGDLILADRRCHNSLIQGGLLSRATFRRFRHNDTAHLEELLLQGGEEGFRSAWVVTETLFSMDGDKAPLDEIIRICRSHGALLYLDDAHAFGVMGSMGLGLAAHREGVDLILGTFGKAGGGFGAFAVTNGTVRDYLVNYCSGFIYSTALPPGVIGAADAAMDLIPGMEEERVRLKDRAELLLTMLNKAGYRCGVGHSHIIPVITADEAAAVELSRTLYDNKIYAQAVRPPAVETSRIRLTLSSNHTEQDILTLIDVFEHEKAGD